VLNQNLKTRSSQRTATKFAEVSQRNCLRLVLVVQAAKIPVSMNKQFGILLLVVVLLALPLAAQKKQTGTDSSTTKPLRVAPDLTQRLAKFRQVQMPFRATGLTTNEKKMVEKLVDASRYLGDIFWRQNDPEALDLYQSLATSDKPS